MRELLAEVWRQGFIGKGDLNSLVERLGKNRLEKAEKRGLIRIAKGKVELTERGRDKIKVVLAGGVFDILHPGHVFFLSRAREEGDVLVVVVARDSTVERRKRIPIVSAKQRVEMVRSLKPVGIAILGSTGDIYSMLERVKPDVVALGPDQGHSEEEIEERAGEMGLKVKALRIEEYKETELNSTKAILQKIFDRRFPLSRRRQGEK